jgi:YVTN family beta-propeller protein
MMRHVLTRGRTRAIATACALGLGVAGAGLAAAAEFGLLNPFDSHQVGEQVGSRILVPSNQWISPIGDRILVNNGRVTSSTISPDGSKLAALTWHNFTGFLSIIDLKTGQIVQQVGTGKAGDPVLGDGTVSPDNPLYSTDGTSLWVPQSGDLLRLKVAADGSVSGPPIVIKLSGPHGAAVPSGMALSSDGSHLYVALNGSNTLGVINTSTNALEKEIPVGNAPRAVVISGNEAFVSNEGGRPAAAGDFTNKSYGTSIVSDPSTGGATTGTLSVVDLAQGVQTSTIPVGLQPTALFLHDKALFVANSNDDSVSIVDTESKQVKQTFNVNPVAKVGSYPNAITMPDDHHVLVSIGRDNAIAQFGYSDPISPVRLQGLLPTDWYPVNVAKDDALGKIVVTNDKGIGSRGAQSTISEGPGTNPATGHNTYDDTGSVTSFQLPSGDALGGYTHQVFGNNAWNGFDEVATEGRRAAPKAIPASLGHRSKIKHVFLIVKENRTYDQVFGDLPKGNGDSSLAQFGATVTPNQHALSNRYSLFDNFYDEGTLSADGHNWLVQADANDYIEKEFGAFTRSYPAEGGDALAYQRNGFLWNAAARAGRTSADFGEYAHFFSAPSPSNGGPTWSQWYKDSQILEGKASGPLPVPIDKYRTSADIPSVTAILDPLYPQYALQVPDQYRVDIWERAFKQSEKTGQLANLTLLRVPNDHTSGIKTGQPNPTAMVADNDLATGRIVSDISHSRFWKDSAIFILEDDPQNGVDHVDGHRSILMVASPYAKRNAVNHHYYSQINVVRTIEQILGIRPMNQMDRAAIPMFDTFTDRPDFRPYDTLPTNVPLDLGVPPSPKADTASALRIPTAARALYRQWLAWSEAQHFLGPEAQADRVNPAQLNRLDWYAATGWKRPYPGDKKLLAPNQVPGRNRPAAEIG